MLTANQIRSLPKKHQLLLSLIYEEGLSMYETAKVMGVTPSVVYRLYLEASLLLEKAATPTRQ